MKTKKNQDVLGSANGDKVGGSIENLSIIAKLAKSKKSKLTKLKKSDLIKAQNFIKANSFKTDFFTFKAKKSFHLSIKSFYQSINSLLF